MMNWSMKSISNEPLIFFLQKALRLLPTIWILLNLYELYESYHTNSAETFE